MDMELLDKISEVEYKMLERYRNRYAWIGEKNTSISPKPIREILKEWEYSNQLLYQLLGNNLIISKEVEFSKPKEKIDDEMYDIMIHNRSINLSRSQRTGFQFYNAIKDWVLDSFPLKHSLYNYKGEEVSSITPEEKATNIVNAAIRDCIFGLISITALVDNVYTGKDCKIPLPNGKDYMVRNGCKPIKALSKLAEAFDLEGFEDFRISHSLVLNQKKLKGDLILSIHPLDYWTMSDNESGWDSCMNWRDIGGYRQGTVEMMNSPCVVVAYLAASDGMYIGSEQWNNKKWRELFIVDKNAILAIKGYPYQNNDLANATVKWLKELAETNMGWKYTSDEPLEWTWKNSFKNPKNPEQLFKISFTSNHMYTDVGSLTSHLLYIGQDIELLDDRMEEQIFTFNYSGASQCMSCGDLDPDICEPSFLCCTACDEVLCCADCGERWDEDEMYSINGMYLCPNCYDNNTSVCEACEEADFDDNFTTIHLLPKLDEETRKWAEKTVYKPSAGFGVVEDLTDYHPEYVGMTQYICHNCFVNFNSKFLKPGCSLFKYYNPYGMVRYGCYIEDLTDWGLRAITDYDFYSDYCSGDYTQKELIETYWRYSGEYLKIDKAKPKEIN